MIPQGTISEAFVRTYDGNFQLTFQQEKSILEPFVRVEEQRANAQAWTYIGESGIRRNRARGSATVHTTIKHSTRWNFQEPATWSPQLIDQLDVLEAMKDPRNAYYRAGMASINRFSDELLLERAFADVVIGNDIPGSTTSIATVHYYDRGECFVMNGNGLMASDDDGTGQPAGGIETDSTGTGLTVAKIQTLTTLFDNASVPATDRVLVTNADQKQMLLAHSRVASIDYNTVKVLPEGEIGRWLGWTLVFLPTSRFAKSTINTTNACIDCLAFQKEALLRTNGIGLNTRITEESQFNYNVQLWAETMKGGLRLQGPGVAKIVLLAHPTPTET